VKLAMFEGWFLNGVRDGEGKELKANGDTFEGRFAKGKKEGKGILTIALTGMTYEGTWVNDFKQGVFKITKYESPTEEPTVVYKMYM
jgi:hypothetical protein